MNVLGQNQSTGSVGAWLVQNPSSHPGEAEGNGIYIDTNAAGNGWLVDSTPGVG
jgi:hypothetical protein